MFGGSRRVIAARIAPWAPITNRAWAHYRDIQPD
jgi:hypothetical protein